MLSLLEQRAQPKDFPIECWDEIYSSAFDELRKHLPLATHTLILAAIHGVPCHRTSPRLTRFVPVPPFHQTLVRRIDGPLPLFSCSRGSQHRLFPGHFTKIFR